LRSAQYSFARIPEQRQIVCRETQVAFPDQGGEHRAEAAGDRAIERRLGRFF
jgi:hypothetical protein